MPSPILWSTNTHLKFRIQRDFRKDRHYVWCSQTFSAATVTKFAAGALQPPSSDPCSIYWQLNKAIANSDRHEAKIIEQRASLAALAQIWFSKCEITEFERDEIVAMTQIATLQDFRPLVYVIPLESVSSRLIPVAASKRASLDPEFILEDLGRDEFDIIELDAP